MMTVYTTPITYTPCHYATNRAMLADPTVNVTFESVLRMSDGAWVAWLGRVRQSVLTQWDQHGVPPRVGLTDPQIATAWNRLASSRSDDVWVTCDDGVEGLFASPTSHSVIGQWFPTMMKTRINYSEKGDGISIHDMFADEALWARYAKSYAARHFRRDSFYAYSQAIPTTDPHPTVPGATVSSVDDYLNLLIESNHSGVDLFGSNTPTHGVWLSPVGADEDYNGYSDGMKDRSIWTVSQADAVRLRDSGLYPAHWFRSVGNTLGKKKAHYMVRLYRTDTRIFPEGMRSFRISMCQYATNFPALVARALYERYTQGVQRPIIWDPSAGWAGRLAGAIISNNRPLYIGCDPNSDHLWTDESGGQHSKYTEIAAYYDTLKPFDPASEVLFIPCGSEVMRDQPAFQEYRGKVDVVFTSCPYFSKEVYSDDPEQSATKFSTFDSWCEGFLKPTIETAAEWLKPGGVLLWNIADIKLGNKMFPLEKMSIQYATGAGLVQESTMRLLLTNMPGANRVTSDGEGTAKNTCLWRGRLNKYEPIFSFRRLV